MAVSKAQQRATNKYKKTNYDRVELIVPKGRKDEIRTHAESQGQSVNAYINAAIDTRMAQEDTGAVGVVSLPSDTLAAAQMASAAAGEAVADFVQRAVAAQAQRDQTSLKLGINPATGGKLEKEA